MKALPERVGGSTLESVQEDVLRVQKVKVIVELLRGGIAWRTVFELQRAEWGLDLVRDRKERGSLRECWTAPEFSRLT